MDREGVSGTSALNCWLLERVSRVSLHGSGHDEVERLLQCWVYRDLYPTVPWTSCVVWKPQPSIAPSQIHLQKLLLFPRCPETVDL
jgi:hypothetical protein